MLSSLFKIITVALTDNLNNFDIPNLDIIIQTFLEFAKFRQFYLELIFKHVSFGASRDIKSG